MGCGRAENDGMMDESDEDYPLRTERIIEEPEEQVETVEDEGVSLDPQEEEMLVETKGAIVLDVEEGKGSEEVDSEPLEFTTEEVEPIQRNLRRLMDTPVYVPDAKDDEGMERYLAKKESLKDDSLDIVSLYCCVSLFVYPPLQFDLTYPPHIDKPPISLTLP